ncbi:hypothetical protein PFISCL1PPCAC_9090, partial [Pristionchus fissidentatus]
DKAYKEWSRELYGEHGVLIQDNAPAHTAKSTQVYFAGEGIKTLDWPTESPDLNAVEIVWANLKRWLQSTWKPKNLEHMKEGIRQWWKEH